MKMKKRLIISLFSSVTLLCACNSGGYLTTPSQSVTTINKNLDPSLYQNCLSNDGASSFIYDEDPLDVDIATIEKGKAKCPTFNSDIQNYFDYIVGSIEDFKFGNSSTNLKQPDILNKNVSDLELAKKMAEYGFKYQQETLIPALQAVCNNLLYVQCKNILQAPKEKDPARVIEKGKGPLFNFDYSRSTVVMDYEAIPTFLKALQGIPTKGTKDKIDIPFNIKVLKNRLLSSTPGHYRDIQLFIEDKNNHFISEVQIFGSEMEQRKNLDSHTLYEEVRRVEKEIESANNFNKVGMEKVVKLENELSGQINDNIFRTDAITSCPKNMRDKCTNEIKAYINNFPKELSPQQITCTDVEGNKHEFTVKKFRDLYTEFVLSDTNKNQKWVPEPSHSVEAVDNNGNFTSAVNFRLLDNQRLSFLNSNNGWALEITDLEGTKNQRLYYWGNSKCKVEK
jgi:hypothetical protein